MQLYLFFLSLSLCSCVVHSSVFSAVYQLFDISLSAKIVILTQDRCVVALLNLQESNWVH